MDTATAKNVDRTDQRDADEKTRKYAVLLREMKKEWG